MNYQHMKRPDLSVFALAITFILSVGGALGGGTGWETAAGVVVIGGGIWATWNIGRWAWSRYGANHIDTIR
jgi:hypothetical protein